MIKEIKKPVRKFLAQNLVIDSWEKLKPYFEDLSSREIKNVQDLEQWIKDRSELEAVLEEDMAWRYIRMTCDTTDKEITERYQFFVEKISPMIAPYDNLFNKKLVSNPFLPKLDKKKFSIYLRGIKSDIEIFRKKNIPLHTKIQTESQKYGAISAGLSIRHEGKEYTLQQASVFLKSPDRAIREEVYRKIAKERSKVRAKLDALYSKLVKLRHQVALNAGFKNYRDYKFVELGRFDYTPKDCLDVHASVQKNLMPLVNEIDTHRKQLLGVKELKPWDLEVDLSGKPPLKPFSNAQELIDKTVECFRKVRPVYADYIRIMEKMKHFDLDSRKGKAPGGYNYPLYESGVPFIFMNSAGTTRDLVTMVHEGGHAIHSFLSRDLEITGFKSVPSEVAELASMSMELISMEHWDVFFENPDDLKRARKEQLEKILKTLPWIAVIDKFQHWIYTHPEHTLEERTKAWVGMIKKYQSKIINYKGQEDNLERMWQAQLHLFEVPFYYIEYGMAQLGAIAVWKNYKKDPKKALDQYEAALSLGYTRSIKDLYKAAGIKFDFSDTYIKSLANFVQKEIAKL